MGVSGDCFGGSSIVCIVFDGVGRGIVVKGEAVAVVVDGEGLGFGGREGEVAAPVMMMLVGFAVVSAMVVPSPPVQEASS